MELQDFIKDIAECFEDTNANDITKDTQYKDLDEWSSLTTLEIIALVKTKNAKTLTGKEIRECNSIGDLFNVVSSK